MAVSLQSRARRFAFLLLCLAAAGFFVLLAGRALTAERYGARPDAQALQHALRLQPGNADLHHRLGRLLFFSQHDATGSIPHYRAAAALNPYRAGYWLDLAAAYQVMGAAEEQRAALAQAVAAEPMSTPVLWEAANYHLVEGNMDESLRLLRVIVAAPNYQLRQEALTLAWRATRDAPLLMDRLLPHESHVYIELLMELIRQDAPEAAAQVWERMRESQFRFPAARAIGYVDFALARGGMAEAFAAWQHLAVIDPAFAAYQPGANLVVNGSFERPLLGRGFEWRIHQQPDISMRLDPNTFRSGGRSLAVTFGGARHPHAGVRQLIRVAPGVEYEFSGYMRAENVRSASGPRFLLQDATTGRRYALTPEVLGSRGWHVHEARFHTGPDTHWLELQVARVPADRLIQGVIWVDDIRLQPVERP